MSQQIPTSFIKRYEGFLRHTLQQRGTLLRQAVDVRTGMSGESAFFDFIGKVESSEKTGRHQPIEFTDTPHSRRRVTSKTRHVADAIDTDDKLRRLMDNPEGRYGEAQAFALGRDVDDIIIDAATATAFGGKDGDTSFTFPSSQRVAVDYKFGMDANCDLTHDKVTEVSRILNVNEVPIENRWAAVGPRQVQSLLADPKVNSIDHNILRPLVEGRIVFWYGFNFIPSNRLKKDGNNRKCLFWHQDGIALGIWQDASTRMDERVDLATMPMQIYSWMDMGATRMEEERVVEVLCDETADIITS